MVEVVVETADGWFFIFLSLPLLPPIGFSTHQNVLCIRHTPFGKGGLIPRPGSSTNLKPTYTSMPLCT